MKTIKANKGELMQVVKKNAQEHKKLYEEAFAAYWEEATEEVSTKLKELKSKKARGGIYIRIEAPADHTKDYQQAIKMLEMSVDDVLEIDYESFQNLVMDDWDWKEKFSSNKYVSTALSNRRAR